eukprot:915870_1
MSQNQVQDAQDEPELVELHFELEIDFAHAFQPDQVITGCIAEVMNINKNDVYFDGVDEIEKDDQYFGLFRGHIPTTKHEIEKLVSIFYNSLQTNLLQQKIQEQSSVNGTPILEIRELYETDQNDDDDDQYIDEEFHQQQNDIYNNSNNNMQQQQQQQQHQQQTQQPQPQQQQQQQQQQPQQQPQNSIDAMLHGLKELLNEFIQDTDNQFDQLLQNCKKQINEEF